ncbi:MAG: 4a-hydroxytetrahydrobiopterin dehydratase [Alicyclobacillus sp.]|nr:4a-hydroxytetrahydrobiopterin dehydratase [Alicyclobacillus sp.]MCL6517526.1 4a-hydroxytetrahydrobiopterin dehydratase [Alicyclobacillus sp.]
MALAERLTDAEIQAALATVPEWRLEEKTIGRRYRFGSFMDAVGFVNRVAEVAERRNHHPFISLDYKVVTLRLTSWHAGGLTQADFDEAAEFDRLYEGMRN